MTIFSDSQISSDHAQIETSHVWGRPRDLIYWVLTVSRSQNSVKYHLHSTGTNLMNTSSPKYGCQTKTIGQYNSSPHRKPTTSFQCCLSVGLMYHTPQALCCVYSGNLFVCHHLSLSETSISLVYWREKYIILTVTAHMLYLIRLVVDNRHASFLSKG